MDATLKAEKRDGRGKNEARRLRASGRIPAVLYGGEKGKAMEIAVDTSDRLLAQLREGVLEVVIGRMTGEPGIDCTFTAIADEGLAVIAAVDHPLAHKRRLEFGALLDYPWIVQAAGSPMRDVIEREFRAHHAPMPKGLIETGSILTTINLIRESNLIAVVPEAVARRDAGHGVLRVLPYRFEHKLEAYGSLTPKDRPLSAPAARFLQLLHARNGAAR